MAADPIDVAALAAIAALLGVLAWRGSARGKGSLAAVLGIAAAHQLIFRTIAEDSYIGFRYSANLAAGRGLVFTAGERVEGYSNFLWTVLLGGVYQVAGAAATPILSAVLGAGLCLLAVYLTYRLALRVTGREAAAPAAALFAAASASVAAYGPSGMETALFTVLVLAFFLALAGARWAVAGALIALAGMTRPEGVLLGIPLLVFAARQPRGERIRGVIAAGLACAALALPWTVWRGAYYGYLLPNTVAAKNGMDPAHQLRLGLLYGAKFAAAHAPVLAILLVAGWQAYRRRAFAGRWGALDWAVAVYAAVGAGFVIAAGGDWMPAWRFLSPLVPLVTVLAARLYQLGGAGPRPGSRAAWAAAAGLCALMVAVSYGRLVPAFRSWDRDTKGLAWIGGWFHRSLPPDTLTACFPCGAFAYYSELPMIDMGGLSDLHIARHGLRHREGWVGHIAHDEAYVARRRPLIVAHMAGEGFESRPVLEAPPEFRGVYVPVSLRFDSRPPEERYLNLLLLASAEERILKLLGHPEAATLRPSARSWRPPGTAGFPPAGPRPLQCRVQS